MRGDAITVASDIYSLGAVLYELLTGVRPHAIKKYTPREIERAICEEDVILPSSATRNRAAARALSGDLDNILVKCLQKEPKRRYPSVEQFTADIRRYLAHIPISARSDTFSYRARKFVRRNRGPLAAGIALTVALGISAVTSLHEAALARQHFAQARKLAGALIFDVHDRVRDLPGSLPAREAIVRIGLGYLDNMAKSARGDFALRLELANAYERIGLIQSNVFGSYTGDTTQAIVSFQKGLEVLRTLDASPSVELERMELLRRLGNVFNYTGRLPEAYLRLEEAAHKGAALLERSPHDYRVRKSLAAVYDDLATAQREGSSVSKGIENQSKAVGLFKELLAASPTDQTLRASVANALSGLGNLDANNGQLPAAMKNYQEAAVEWDALSRDEPNNMTFNVTECLFILISETCPVTRRIPIWATPNAPLRPIAS